MVQSFRRRRGLLKGAGVEPRRVAIGLVVEMDLFAKVSSALGLGTPETRRN